MGAWKVNRARAALALANLIVIAGFAAVLPLVVTAFAPGTAAMAVPLPMLVALAGLLAMLLGSAIAARQRDLLHAYRDRRADAQRRVRAYRIDERIEPSLAPRGKQQQA